MSPLVSLVNAALLVAAAQVSAASAVAQTSPTVVFETAMGRIVVELDPEHAPRTVNIFLAHVNGRFFDGLIFHRVISGFMIQAGIMTEAFESRVSSALFLELEETRLPNVRGSVAMAHASDPHTAQSFSTSRRAAAATRDAATNSASSTTPAQG